jgi:hypothetical protein
VKRGLLRLHFFNEFFDPLIRERVRYSGHKASIVLDLLVEFDALLTHAWFRIAVFTSLRRRRSG